MIGGSPIFFWKEHYAQRKTPGTKSKLSRINIERFIVDFHSIHLKSVLLQSPINWGKKKIYFLSSEVAEGGLSAE